MENEVIELSFWNFHEQKYQEAFILYPSSFILFPLPYFSTTKLK